MIRITLLALLVFPLGAGAQTADWAFTEGGSGGGRFSPLTDIDATNVHQLEIAWTYRHGDEAKGSWILHRQNGSAMESTPIVVDGRLIFTTPFNRVIALDPETGEELWSFDPEVDRGRTYHNFMINRGVAYWRGDQPGSCSRRVFLATLSMRLWALDAVSGEPCLAFGQQGVVDLVAGLGPGVDSFETNMTSPPTIVGDVIVVGSSIADKLRQRAPPGDVRGFDVRTGELRWTFHTIPGPSEPGAETWEGNGREISGAANVWTTMTADPARDLVFLPVSSASPDYYGGDRVGANLYSNSLVALRASTGERVWHFQMQHHDLWDYDLPAPPNLVQVRRDGVLIDAVAQVTKTGLVFVLDRQTGVPIFPIEERAVPQSDVPGEASSPTQPIPTKPPPLLPTAPLGVEDLWDVDAKHRERCAEWLSRVRNEGLFTPPSLEGSLIRPADSGGANWSGAAYNPLQRRLFVPVNLDANVITLEEVPGGPRDTGRKPYSSALDGIVFVFRGTGTGLRYRIDPLSGREPFEIGGRPCTRPPWGRLVAVDLDEGAIRWSVASGQENGVHGLYGLGPALATASGLVFHAGTMALNLRVHDADTGDVIHRIPLPAGLHAGPISYKLSPEGPQWLVIAPGGHTGLRSKLGDYVIAYRLKPSASGSSRGPAENGP